MKKNIGLADRIVRILLAAIIAVLYFTNTVTGVFGITLLIIAAVLLLTSLINFCPLYFLFGLNTSKTKSI